MKKSKLNSKIFIPGLGERAKDYKGRFKKLAVFNIDWNNIKLPKQANVVAAFSMGGVLAVEIKCNTLILCSMTPIVFDINRVKAKKIIFIEGEKEDSAHAKKLFEEFKGDKQFILVPGATHKINKLYAQTIENLM